VKKITGVYGTTYHAPVPDVTVTADLTEIATD
jgi:hypothetical protein